MPLIRFNEVGQPDRSILLSVPSFRDLVVTNDADLTQRNLRVSRTVSAGQTTVAGLQSTPSVSTSGTFTTFTFATNTNALAFVNALTGSNTGTTTVNGPILTQGIHTEFVGNGVTVAHTGSSVNVTVNSDLGTITAFIAGDMIVHQSGASSTEMDRAVEPGGMEAFTNTSSTSPAFFTVTASIVGHGTSVAQGRNAKILVFAT